MKLSAVLKRVTRISSHADTHAPLPVLGKEGNKLQGCQMIDLNDSMVMAASWV